MLILILKLCLCVSVVKKQFKVLSLFHLDDQPDQGQYPRHPLAFFLGADIYDRLAVVVDPHGQLEGPLQGEPRGLLDLEDYLVDGMDLIIEQYDLPGIAQFRFLVCLNFR